MSKLPGATYLRPLRAARRDQLLVVGAAIRGDKCECKSNAGRPSGAWVVDDGGTFYTFDPSTQIQKDIWLDEATRAIGRDEAIAMLRWYCFTCATVQMP